jgi:TRAP-type C4-dicarboxylate transport system permease small subunit
MTRVSDAIFRFLNLCLALCLAVMVALVFGNVVLRYAFNGGITLSEELSRWLFVYLTFLGAIVGLRDHAHLGMDNVVRRLSPRLRRACYLVCHVLMLWISVLILEGSWQQTAINLDAIAPSSGLPMAVFYAPGIVFALGAIAILSIELARLAAGRLRADELVIVRESEELEALGSGTARASATPTPARAAS